MKQLIPAARALSERIRQPGAMRLTAGLALLTPAVLFSATDGVRKPAGNQNAKVVHAQVIPALAMNANVMNHPAFEDAMYSVAREDSAKAATKFAREYNISESLARDIHKAAVETGIKPKIAFGLVQAESSFRPRVVSPVGAVGLTQVMPATAREVAPGTTRQDLMRPETNLKVGFTYLKRLIDKYGDEELALTAYNRGPGTVNRLLKRGRNPDNGYAEKVITGKSQRHVDLMNAKFGR